MSTLLFLSKPFYFISLVMVLCNVENESQSWDKRINLRIAITFQQRLPDTVRTIIPDDYPVSNKMLEKHFYINGQQYSEEFRWFTNDTLKQTILFQLYTDYHRLSIFHFINDNIPKELFDPLFAREFGCEKIKKSCIDSNIKSADRINQKYFRSNKGVRLRKNKQDVVRLYGKADKIIKHGDTDIYSWGFVGDLFRPDWKSKTNKPYAKDSFGYQVRMFFRNDKLIAIHLHNDIP